MKLLGGSFALQMGGSELEIPGGSSAVPMGAWLSWRFLE
jgi:hypothetical protein